MRGSRGLRAVILVLAVMLAVVLVIPNNAKANTAYANTVNIGDKVRITDYLNVRARAGTAYPVVDCYGAGEITEVAGYYRNWLIVPLHSRGYGYIYGAYAEPVSPVKPATTNGDLYWLSRIVSAESKGEPFRGQVAVANVVLNRVASNWFPDTVKEVVFQSYGSIPQFSPVDNGSIYYEPTASAVEAARQALSGYVVVPDALYFYNPELVSWRNWIRSRTIVARIGGHVFAM